MIHKPTATRPDVLYRATISGFSAVMLWCSIAVAEKVLIYDEERGIIEVERGETGKPKKTPALPPLPKPAPKAPIEQITHVAPSQPKPRAKSIETTTTADLHVGRQKDPPDVYFSSGTQYFKNGQFNDALKNFQHADSLSSRPEYKLWIGKSLRQLGDIGGMFVMMDSILRSAPLSEVADDALFEEAFYFQSSGTYDSAIALYAKLAEQYPDGSAYSSGEEFLETSRNQRHTMQSELVLMLRSLGYLGSDLDQMLHDFQMANDLISNGNPNARTVSLIKSAYSLYIKDQDLRAQKLLRFEQRKKIMLITSSVLLICLLVLIIIRIAIGQQRKRIETLRQTLSEFKVESL